MSITTTCCGVSPQAILKSQPALSTAQVDAHLRALTDHAIREIVASDFAPLPNRRVSPTDRFLMLTALNGIRVDDPALDGQTLALGLTNRHSGNIYFQTAPVQRFHTTPFRVTYQDEQGGTLHYDHEDDPHAWDVGFGGTFIRQRSHHFNQSDADGNLLPVSIITNPNTACSEACDGCSRVALGFTPVPEDYIAHNVQEVITDFRRRFPDLELSALQYVSLMTGCQPDAQREVQMFVESMRMFRQHGFDPGFMVYSNRINSREHLELLRNEGAIGYGSTVESIDDGMRRVLWGDRKGAKEFSAHLEVLALAREIFKIAEATLVLGQDGQDALNEGILKFREMGITIAGNVLRAYNATQLGTIHPDVWRLGLDYFADTFEIIYETNSRQLSSARYMRQLALDYLKRRFPDAEITDRDVPYKYRG